VAADVAGGDSQRRSEMDLRAAGGQRERLVAAFAKAAAEYGYVRLEVEQVLRYAGLPRATFDEHFTGKEQGLVAAQDAFFEGLWLDVAPACEVSGEWPVKVRAAVVAILTTLYEADSLARVFAVEATSVSLVAVERQFAMLDQFAELLRDGRSHYPAARSLPEMTERILVGGIASIVSGHLLMEDSQAIPSLENELVELVLIPYLGAAEARRAASR
jgi:AcrR family transcriptional regulator